MTGFLAGAGSQHHAQHYRRQAPPHHATALDLSSLERGRVCAHRFTGQAERIEAGPHAQQLERISCCMTPPAVSRRTAELGEAAIQHMAQRAWHSRHAGCLIINLSIGEPDFATPAHICEAAGKAPPTDSTAGALIAGFPSLRAAIARKLREENGA